MRRTVAVLAAAGAVLAPAAAAAGDTRERLTSASFELEDQAGQTIYVSGVRRQVSLGIEGRRTGIAYLEPGEITARRLRADFGPFGSVAMRFKPQGDERFHPAPGPCEGGTTVQPGVFTGELEFTGDDGYAPATATSAEGTVVRTRIRCDDDLLPPEPIDQNRGQAATILGAVNGIGQSAGDVDFTAIQQDDKNHALFYANAYGRESGVRVVRFALRRAPGERFVFDFRRGRARVEPPPPFAGAAELDRGDHEDESTWTGDLTVTYPGTAPVALTGPEFMASISRGIVITFREVARTAARALAQLAR